MKQILRLCLPLLLTCALAACGSSSGSSSGGADREPSIRITSVDFLPEEPSKTRQSHTESAALRGSTHTLYRYSAPYAVLDLNAGYRISTDIRSGIRSFTQDAQVNALTDEAYALMIETCDAAGGARLGRFKAAKDDDLGTLETFFSCIRVAE